MDSKKVSRREFLRWSAMGAGAALLAGCLPAGAPVVIKQTVVVEKEAAPAAAPPAKPSELSGDLAIWVWHDNELQIDLTKPLFNERFPNIKVTPQLLEFSDLHNKLFTSLAAGAGAPDISWVELSQLGKFAYYGPEAGLVDMLPLMERDGISRSAFLGWAFNNGLDKTKSHLCVFPRAVCPAGVFYRRDHFDAVGLPSSPEEVGNLLKDWPSWFETAQKIADPANERYFLINLESHGPVYDTLGGANYFDENGELRIGKDPLFTELLEWHLKGRQAGIDSVEIKDEWGPEGQTALKNGMITTERMGVWWTMFLKNFAPDTAGKWGIVNVPQVSGANGGGDNCVIPAQGKQIEAAWEYTKFICTDREAFRQLLVYGAIVPMAWKEYYSLPDFNRPDPFYGNQSILSLAQKVLQQMPGLVLNPNDPIAVAALTKYVGQCVRDGGNPEKALQDAREEILNQIQA